MSRFDYLKRLIQSSNKALPELVEAERGLVKNPKVIEVLGEPTKRDLNAMNMLPIEDADILSPKLHNVDLPLTSDQEKLKKAQALAAMAVAGGAGVAGYNMLSDDPETSQAALPATAPQVPAAMPPKEIDTETEKVLKGMVGQLSRPSAEESAPEASKVIDFGQNQSIASLEKLKELQERSKKAVLDNQFARIGAQLATGSSGKKNNYDEAIGDQIKFAKDLPEDYLKQVQFEKEDPNSAMSQGYKQLAKSMGFDVQGSASAADLERLIPQLANVYNQQEAQKARKDTAKENREARLQELQLRLAQSKSDKATARELKDDTFTQGLRKEATSGEYGKMFANYNTANRMSTAIDEFRKNPSGYSDYATMMGGLKALQGDESVVREAEIRLGMNATSLGNKVKNWGSQLATGKSLQPSQRAEMVKVVDALSQISKRQYADAVEPLMRQAKHRGVNPDFILDQGMLQTREQQAAKAAMVPGKTVVRKGYNVQTNQTQLIYSDGTKEIVNGRQ